MNFVHEQLPTPVLRPFIERFAVIEFAKPLRDSHLPHTGAVAAFSFRGECIIDNKQAAPDSAFTGLSAALSRHEHRDGHSVLLVTFTSAGASGFSNIPLREAAAGTTALANVVGESDALSELHVHLKTAPNHDARIALVETFFLSNLRTTAPDPLVSAALSWLKLQPAQSRIRDLVQHIGLSQSALERRFHHSVGISPKKFAMLVRMQRAVRLSKSGVRLSTVAHLAGYFDQSHFTNDFHRVAGVSPELYFAGTR